MAQVRIQRLQIADAPRSIICYDLSMKKIIIILGIFIALGVAYWLISPLFITVRVSEGVEEIMKMAAPDSSEQAEPEVVATGTFEGLKGHRASGTAKLLKIGEKYFIRLDDDFYVTNGPDLFVHLGRDGVYAAEARLASLKGNEGSQNYEVPEGVDVSKYNEVWIWCRAFSVEFGKAILE